MSREGRFAGKVVAEIRRVVPGAEVRRLEIVDRARDYVDQKQALEKLFEKTGREVFVASVMVDESESDGSVTSWATWTRGAATLLPETVDVALFDDRGEEISIVIFSPWDALRAVASRLMTLDRAYPPRWLVEDFPSDAELEELKKAPGARVIEKRRA